MYFDITRLGHRELVLVRREGNHWFDYTCADCGDQLSLKKAHEEDCIVIQILINNRYPVLADESGKVHASYLCERLRMLV